MAVVGTVAVVSMMILVILVIGVAQVNVPHPRSVGLTTSTQIPAGMGTQTPLYTLTSPNAQEFGGFGSSAAVSATTVVVGAPSENASGEGAAGHAYTFNSTTGDLISTLISPNAQIGGWFGTSVAVSGTTVVVGAPGENASGVHEAGHAYTFNSTTGDLISTLTSPSGQVFGDFGDSVAVSGTTVVVGADGENASGEYEAGHAYTFNATTGDLISTLTSPKPQAGGGFGLSVAISGTTVVVGAYGEEVSGKSYAGQAYTFDATTGKLISTLTSPEVQKDAKFGASVAISGTTVVVGAWLEKVSGKSYAGQAYTFDATTGDLIATLTSPKVQKDAYFGFSVAISGSTVVVGAFGEKVSKKSSAGQAYTFDATTGKLIATLANTKPQAYGSFGSSVAISETTVVVGAYYETASGELGAGLAYVY